MLTISEQRISEMEKVIQSEMRLDSIQKLAAGIAHEINNPLMGIINYGNIIRNHRSAEPDVRNYARVIIEQGERISGIVRNLILFSKSDNEEATWVRFEEIVSAVEGMISALLRSKNLELIKDIPQELPELFLKQSQIKEVLYYLLYYYAAAMASQGGGIRLTAKFIKGSDAGKPEETNLEIRVSGSLSLEIDPDNAFQPFERIQSDDTRVGMGLSVCYGIIQSNRGKLLVRKSSSGTDFFVKLPVKFR